MNNRDLELAFDIGHSSIGWAVLNSSETLKTNPDLLGCGVVTFGADDCLASKRRVYRRQRRHVRATRQRIERIETLLAHLGVLADDELQAKHAQGKGHASPWLLAARVLSASTDEQKAEALLTWPRLWDVIRWYAHNRGYDGNRRWSSADAEEEKKNSEKEENAQALMIQHGRATMAETLCAELGLDPFGSRKSSEKRFKGLNAAFPRDVVRNEVRRLLEFHTERLRGVDAPLVRALIGDGHEDANAWKAVPCADLKIPKRYFGSLLFGQLIPRFENRIVARCPFTGEKVPAMNAPQPHPDGAPLRLCLRLRLRYAPASAEPEPIRKSRAE